MSSETWKIEKDLCRCCHIVGSFTSLAEPSQELPQAETLSEMLRCCFDIDICPEEGTYNASTYTICEPCILQLRDASNFKQQVLRCEERFRDMYRNVIAPGDLKVEMEEENTVQYEFKEEYFETSDDEEAVAADDAHDDTPLPKQPRLETTDDETDQVKHQKEMIGPEEIISNFDFKKNTATNSKTTEANGKGTTNKNYNLLKRNQTPLAVHIASREKLKQGNNNLMFTECAYQTETLDSLGQHSKLHDKNRCFVCDMCGYTANSKYILMNHFKSENVHSDKKLRAGNICESRTNDIGHLEKHKQHLCTVCGYKSQYKGNFIQHLCIHDGKEPYSCSKCEYKTRTQSNLKRHLQVHTGGVKPYSCSVCNFKCNQKHSLTRHIRRHTGEKPYSCSFCGYKCASKSNLKVHLFRSHNREKPCSYSENTVTLEISLEGPLPSHAGEKPYSCSRCEYKTSIKSNLTRHLRVHSGVKPYSCSVCEYRCAAKCDLKKHLRTHTGEKPYSCSFCEFKCATTSSLTSHLQIHSGLKA